MIEDRLDNIDNILKQVLAQRKTQYKGMIHHYTSPIGLKNILQHKKIWFSDIRFLNDSTENNYIYSLFPKFCDTYAECLLDKKYYEIITTISEQFMYHDFCCVNNKRLWSENVFVASFAKDKNNLTLWNYYTKNEDRIGYNISFQNKPFSIDLSYYKYIYGEVIYNEKEQKNLLKDIIIKYNNLYVNYKEIIENDENIKDIFISHFVNIIELYNIFFKHPKYDCEKEYRWAIYNISDDNEIKMQYRIYKGIFIPYIEIPYDEDMIIQVGVGPSGNKELMRKSIDSFISSVNLPRVHSWVSNIPLRY